MDTNRILSELRAERDRLDRAINAIESLNSSGSRAQTRVARSKLKEVPHKRGRRRLSAAARKKLSAMMKARWAAGKMGRKKTA